MKGTEHADSGHRNRSFVIRQPFPTEGLFDYGFLVGIIPTDSFRGSDDELFFTSMARHARTVAP